MSQRRWRQENLLGVLASHSSQSVSFLSVRDPVSEHRESAIGEDMRYLLISGSHRHTHARAHVQHIHSILTSVSELWALKKTNASKNTEVVTEVGLLLAVGSKVAEHPRSSERGNCSA